MPEYNYEHQYHGRPLRLCLPGILWRREWRVYGHDLQPLLCIPAKRVSPNDHNGDGHDNDL